MDSQSNSIYCNPYKLANTTAEKDITKLLFCNYLHPDN